MNEDQAKQIQELVQEVASEMGASFDIAFKSVIGVLKLHALNTPKGNGRAGGPTQAR
jgi:hypothetical protein